MNKPVYPIGSAHRKHDLWQELPRIDMGIHSQRHWAECRCFFKGCYCGAVISVVLWIAIWYLVKGVF